MKLLYSALLCLLALAPLSVNAQVTWNEIPAVPLNPTAGQTSPQSYDVMTGEDGRIYAAYIFDNGSNQQIYFQEYVAGMGWGVIYNDFVYSGFEAIHSYKLGSDIFVFVKRDDAVSTQMMRLYKITAGSVSIVQDFSFADLPNGADFRSVLSEDGNFIYMLHKNDTDSFLEITQFNIPLNNVTTSTVPTGSASVYNYDLVEHEDTVYIGLTHESLTAGEFRHYLHKTDVSMGGVIPHHPGNVDGQMGLVGPSTSLMGLVMSKDIANHEIHMLTRDENNNFVYKFTPATLTTTSGGSTTNYAPLSSSPAASQAMNGSSLYFGSFNSIVSATGYVTTIIQHDYATDQLIYQTASNFDNVSDLSTNCHFSYSQTANKGIAVLYDGAQSKTRYYKSNNTPFVSSLGTESGPVCPTVASNLISGIQITDPDGDAISVSVSAADGAMFPAGSLATTALSQAGNITTFGIVGTPAMGGQTTLTITFDDGINTGTVQYIINVIPTVAPPTFNQGGFSICSNTGMVDMSSYVSAPGGTFNIGGSGTMFNGMYFNSNTTLVPYGTQSPMQYTIVSSGCNLSTTALFIFNESPTVSMTVTPTTCGGNTGSATATISGGTMPYLMQAWSSGQTSTTSVNNLTQGTYTFTVQDANLCSVINEFTVVPVGVDIVPTITNVSCYGANDGSISTSLIGFTAPTTMIWSSGYSVPSINNVVPGTYTLTVTDASNCVYTETFTVTQPTQITATTAVTSPTCGNTDGSMEVQNMSGGVGPYTVNWSTGGLLPLETNIGYGVYSATITDFTGCQTIKTVYVSELNSANLTGLITGSQCGSNTGEIDVTPFLADPNATVQNILWSSGELTEDLSNKSTGTYVCILTTDANCHAVKGWNIPIVSPEVQPICIVTVDSLTSTNLVVWEEVQPIGIHHYNIYRETSSQGEYILIDTVEASNISLFNDVVASPLSRSWSYKISAVNGCNVEGPLSAQHRTMHLSAIYAGTNQTQVSWNAYEGTSYSSFDLWRYTDAAGWELEANLPATQTSYIDNTDFTTPGLDYMVELQLDQQCSALVYRAQDFNTTRSNKDKGNFILGEGTGDSNNDLNEWLISQIEVYPNPAATLLFIEQSSFSNLEITITDIFAKQIAVINQSDLISSVDLKNLNSGNYFVEIKLNNAKRIKHIIKL